MMILWVVAFIAYVVIGVRLHRRAKKHFLGTERQWMGEGDIDPALFSDEGQRLLRISQRYGLIGFAVIFGWLMLMQ
jgi:hypothetical protein